MHWAGTYFALGLPKYERGEKPLYHLDLLTQRREEIVIVCEGEKCADKLQKLGLLATTSGSAKSAEGADWTPLAGRKVIIWPDHDEPGQHYANDLIQRLTEIECTIQVIDTTRLGLDKGGDAVDWLKVHPGATKEEILGLARQGTSDAAVVAPTTVTPGDTLADADLEIIARWCAERCIFISRAWGGITPLYRDLCDWCGPDYSFAPGEFRRLLKQMGVVVGGVFAHGLSLIEDVTYLRY